VSRRLIIGSFTVRALLTLAVVFAGYVLLHEHFAAIDAALAQAALELLGFQTGSPAPATLLVSAGETFNVYAVVTGSCSSTAGALGIAAVSLVLLPGKTARRTAGGLLGISIFVALNIARICSIVVLGWWLAVVDGPLLVLSLVAPLLACAVVLLAPRAGILARVVGGLGTVLFAVLLYGVARGHDYSAGMVSYHALIGPALTFSSLAVAIVLVWQLGAGPVRQPTARVPLRPA
jgi:hypothetical protein